MMTGFVNWFIATIGLVILFFMAAGGQRWEWV
jgi:hypothetical protein